MTYEPRRCARCNGVLREPAPGKKPIVFEGARIHDFEFHYPCVPPEAMLSHADLTVIQPTTTDWGGYWRIITEHYRYRFVVKYRTVGHGQQYVFANMEVTPNRPNYRYKFRGWTRAHEQYPNVMVEVVSDMKEAVCHHETEQALERLTEEEEEGTGPSCLTNMGPSFRREAN